MKTSYSPFVTLFPLLANTVSLHTLFLFFTYDMTPVSDIRGLLIWWGCLSLTFAILTLFLRKPRTLRGVILIAAGGFVLQLVLTIVFTQRYSFLAWVALIFMWLGMYYRCCSLLLEGIKPESVIAAFETTVVMLFVAAFSVTLSVMTAEALLCMAIGVLLTLIALAQVRSGNARITPESQGNQKGRFLLVALLVTLGAGAAVLCMLITNTASQLLTQFTKWFFSILRSISKAVGCFLRWLASLLPEKDMDSTLMNEPNIILPEGAAEWGTIDNPIPFYLLLAMGVLLVLFALFWLWRNGGFHSITFRLRTTGHITRKRRSSKHLLLLLWQRFSRWLAFQYSYLRLRNTAPGLFVWLERQMRPHRMERLEHETPRAFLSRLQNHFPESAETLARLATCLDLHYFGGGHTLSAAEITSMRKQLAQELRQR